MAVVCDHGDRFFVIASQDSEHRSSTLGFECNAIADAELQHGFVSAHLTTVVEAGILKSSSRAHQISFFPSITSALSDRGRYFWNFGAVPRIVPPPGGT
jgi:hypothetical protein